MATLRSPDSQSGTLTIRSRSHYAVPPDVDCVLTLTGERFATYAQFLAADDLEPCLAPITDGWRSRIRGYAAGRRWTKQYVLGGENRFALQATRLQVIIDTLLADGRQGQAVQGVACSPPTAPSLATIRTAP